MARPPARPAPGLSARGRPVARGAAENPAGRFERLTCAEEPQDAAAPSEDAEPGGPPPLRTRFYRDPSRGIFAHNQSPDVGFDTSLNPYRGCEHGCIYCYARPTHEYLGFSAGLDFETHILVKEDAPELVRKALASPRWEPRVVAIGAATDPYQPVERRLRITRRCLEVFFEFHNPVALVTKSALVTRDLDLLAPLARERAAAVQVSITTLDERVRRAMEPRASSPRARLDAVRALADAGVPVGVMVAPVVPGLTDSEIPAIVEAAARAGARSARFLVMRLPYGVKELFEHWLERHFPERKAKVLGRVRALRDGRLNDPRFHSRHRGSGPFAEQIRQLFELARRRAGLGDEPLPLSTGAFRRPGDAQLELL